MQGEDSCVLKARLTKEELKALGSVLVFVVVVVVVKASNSGDADTEAGCQQCAIPCKCPSLRQGKNRG